MRPLFVETTSHGELSYLLSRIYTQLCLLTRRTVSPLATRSFFNILFPKMMVETFRKLMKLHYSNFCSNSTKAASFCTVRSHQGRRKHGCSAWRSCWVCEGILIPRRKQHRHYFCYSRSWFDSGSAVHNGGRNVSGVYKPRICVQSTSGEFDVRQQPMVFFLF